MYLFSFHSWLIEKEIWMANSDGNLLGIFYRHGHETIEENGTPLQVRSADSQLLCPDEESCQRS